MAILFNNRLDAGLKLAEKLAAYKNSDAVVLAIPRGGVPIGDVIARQLDLPLDLALSKKIGHPFHSEYAIGAVSLVDNIVNPGHSDVPSKYIDQEVKRLRDNLQQRYQLFRGNTQPLSLENKTVIVTDDGVATGSTILSTARMAKKQGAARVVIAVPVAAPGAEIKLQAEADHVVILEIPAGFMGVGQFYRDFNQVSDQEVIELMKEHNKKSL